MSVRRSMNEKVHKTSMNEKIDEAGKFLPIHVNSD